MKTLLLPALAAVLLAGATPPVLALYKVVQPDGSVTYTDRPLAAGSGRIITLGRNATPAEPEAVFPLELRQPTQRYPVTLYTSSDCAPCDSGRRLLQQRGIPYSERLVTSDADAAALGVLPMHHNRFAALDFVGPAQCAVIKLAVQFGVRLIGNHMQGEAARFRASQPF